MISPLRYTVTSTLFKHLHGLSVTAGWWPSRLGATRLKKLMRDLLAAKATRISFKRLVNIKALVCHGGKC